MIICSLGAFFLGALVPHSWFEADMMEDSVQPRVLSGSAAVLEASCYAMSAVAQAVLCSQVSSNVTKSSLDADLIQLFMPLCRKLSAMQITITQ